MAVSRNRVNPETPSSAGTTGRRYGGIDSEERQRQRRARLIEAALAVFGEQGYHQSTVRDVCKQAQLTSRYFYESFDGMEDLFRAVYADVSRDLMQATVMALARSEPEPDKLAESALRAFFEFIRDDPRRARVALIDALNVGGEMQTAFDKAQEDFALLIQGFMTQMFPRLPEAGLNHNTLAQGLVGSNTRIATKWVADRCRMPLEDVLRNTYSLFQAAIMFARDVEARLPPTGQADKALSR